MTEQPPKEESKMIRDGYPWKISYEKFNINTDTILNYELCEECNSLGIKIKSNDLFYLCPECNGIGYYIIEKISIFHKICPKCKGKGIITWNEHAAH